MTSSEEMAKLAFGDPGFWDFIKGVGSKVLKGAVKSIPFIGGIASEFIDPAINALTAEPDNKFDSDGDDYDLDEGEAY